MAFLQSKMDQTDIDNVIALLDELKVFRIADKQNNNSDINKIQAKLNSLVPKSARPKANSSGAPTVVSTRVVAARSVGAVPDPGDPEPVRFRYYGGTITRYSNGAVERTINPA